MQMNDEIDEIYYTQINREIHKKYKSPEDLYRETHLSFNDACMCFILGVQSLPILDRCIIIEIVRVNL